MKNLNKKQKIITLVVAIIIIAGIIVTATIGLNYDLRYQNAKRIELYIEKSFEISDIKNITNEVMPNTPVLIEKIEIYEDTIGILAKDITDEQKQEIINKVNEKYGTELSADEIEIVSIPNTRGRDLVKPYLLPFSIATIIILIYFAIRYLKIGALKILLNTIINLVISQLVLLSVIAIARIPIGRITMPLVIIVFLLMVLKLTNKFEKKLKSKKENEEKGI